MGEQVVADVADGDAKGGGDGGAVGAVGFEGVGLAHAVAGGLVGEDRASMDAPA